MFDVLIIGGGVSGMQCALVLGSGLKKTYALDKKIGIIMHQKASHLQNALFNNVLGLEKETKGSDLLKNGENQLSENYPDVQQINQEKVISIIQENDIYVLTTNKNIYYTKIAVLALNYTKPLSIRGLEEYVEVHQRANPAKDRIQLKNKNHLVKDGLYVCGTIAGWRSQFSIAAGSGASVATDILTVWNNNIPTKVHDKK
ncbi:MAG: NAD(P)/FAD-dependent oxidoreductase [Flavobacteriaceae bacterium]